LRSHSHWIYTMIRCASALIAAAMLATAAPVLAQRNFPREALRGEMIVLQAPDILLNGRPARLAPGSRVRGADNLLVPPAALAQQRLVVHYTRDLYGQPLEVWLLSAEERSRTPWPVTAEQASSWLFDATAQRWSRP
jgi:hypothetical protein